MPRRVIDGEAIWGSDKLHDCPPWARREYPWLYPLADAFGCFELNLRIIAGKLRPNRPELTETKLEAIFTIFEENGLAFIWSEGGKSYVHWTGSERPGRLPSPSRRTSKFERRLAPSIPSSYQSYLQRFSGNNTAGLPHRPASLASASARARASAKEKTHKSVCVLFEIWNQHRGELPEALKLTVERERKCKARLKTHQADESKFLADFQMAVQRAAQTPFLLGQSARGWKAGFDWLIANDTNYLAVLEGKYSSEEGQNFKKLAWSPSDDKK